MTMLSSTLRRRRRPAAGVIAGLGGVLDDEGEDASQMAMKIMVPISALARRACLSRAP